VFDGNMSSEADMLEFTIGQGQVVQGLDDGVVGMRVGGKRHLVVPPRMGYGATGVAGHVPRNSVIHLELELHERGSAVATDTVGEGMMDGSTGSFQNMRDGGESTEAALSESDKASSGRMRNAHLSNLSTGMGSPAPTGQRAKNAWSMSPNEDTFNTLPPASKLGSFGGTFNTMMGAGGPAEAAGSTVPQFHHMSTCHALKYVEGGFAPLQLPGYGADKSLGYVVMSPGEGQTRKLVVYAPVFQADLADGASVQQADPSVGLDNSYKVSDEAGSNWLLVLKGQDQSARFERAVDVGGSRKAAESMRSSPLDKEGQGGGEVVLDKVQVTIPAGAASPVAE